MIIATMGASLEIPGSISTLQLQPIALGLTKLGFDASRIFGRCGLSISLLAEHNTRLPAAAGFAVWEAVIEATGEPSIALRMAGQVDSGYLGALEYVVRNSATARVALERAIRFQRVLDDLSDISFVEQGTRCILRHARLGGYPNPPQCVEYLFAATFHVFAEIHPEARAQRVTFTHAALAAVSVYERCFGCPVLFEQPHNEVCVSAAFLDKLNPKADVRLGQVLEQHLQSMLAELPIEEPWLHRARTQLSTLLVQGQASPDALARALRVSTRTLRRRLAEHGTSYRAVLNGVRHLMARQLVSGTNDSFDRVSARLGFADPSAFYRAFRHWTGTTPAAYRVRR